MTKSIRHLRGSETQWKNNDIIIPDGELAIMRTAGGGTKIKVGNGTDTFSALRSVDGDYVQFPLSATNQSFTLESNMIYHTPNVRTMTLTLPTSYDADFCCMICMDTRFYTCDFSLDGVYFTGDDVVDGEFVPVAGKSYTLFIWYATSFQGVIRGVPYAN